MLLDKPVDLGLLAQQLTAAGVAHNGLVTSGDDGAGHSYLYTIDATTGALAELPSASAAAAVYAAHVAPLTTTGFFDTRDMRGRVQTVGAESKELYRATLTTMTAYKAAIDVDAFDAGNGSCRSLSAKVVAKRLNGGAVLVGTTALSNLADGATPPAANSIVGSVSGNDFIVTVTGTAGRTYDWLMAGTVKRYAPSGLST